MPERTYLNSTYEERVQVKALGARWDAGMRKWYVTDDLDLTPFAAWLPAGADTSPLRVQAFDESESRDVALPNKGIPLSRLLGGVANLVSKAFGEGVWTTAEVLKVSSARGGHVYLELSERSPSTGEVMAQARAVIWSRFAEAMLSDFRRVTGADLEAGIKVLLRAKPVFKSQFGFSLEVDAIDPNYTLGDLEARRREIRERLKKERLFDRNRSLPAPWDFTYVLVVAPERAAGLGDFAKEAQRLQAHGACQFSYVHSRFQGEGAAAEIAEALCSGLLTWSGAELPDAVVILRGGGSVSDLAWLNDYALARCICECPVPVLTGIGHERDETSLDEVAHRKFDTPSKVILGIEEVMRARVREARAFNDSILNLTRRAATTTATDVLHLRRDIEQAAKAAVAQARADSNSAFESLRHASTASLRDARSSVRESVVAVRSDARQLVQSARHTVPAVMADIDTRARASVLLAKERSEGLLPKVLERSQRTARAARRETELAIREIAGLTGRLVHLRRRVDTLLPAVLDQAASTARTARRETELAIRETAGVAAKLGHVRRRVEALLPAVLEQASSGTRTQGQAAERLMRETAERATRGVDVAAERSQALFREIAGQGPQKTLRRGFAVVRSSAGEAVTSAATVQPGAAVQVDLHDGTVRAVVETVTQTTQEGGA
ncbi:exodeoxyribonuclease VII large subunit [Paucibacter sp. M5-1]|uniref:exodeoxyribonuclease VII large subunit n=1 Tax=Paucibacter sp. M5-1 TaxID=3015998 RepID=UPI0022B8C86E|nr:exodeoxyribonuclease VII large subunit [Paucibacter sp. M5-1]MCZ7884627.1 exodeoxyribonuclease VII large subunit [Paucibacter sp. M5-1]